MKKVVAAGHICLDITPKIPEQASKRIEEILPPGSLLNVGAADLHTGGAVANTGLAMKLLGADVKLAGKIGEDAFGELIRSIAAEHGAADGLIVQKGESTSYSIVLAIPGLDRLFLHHPGANDTFCAEDLPEELLKDAALFHFGYPTVMKRMYEEDGQELARVLAKAGRSGAAVSLDLSSVDPNSPAGRADWEAIFRNALPRVDFFVPSAEELLFMLEREKYDALRRDAAGGDLCDVLTVEHDLRPLAGKCLSLGAKVVLIKCGAQGMYLQTAAAEELAKIPAGIGLEIQKWADLDLFERSYKPEKVLSGTGAGDTSIAAFLTAMLRGYDPEDCLHLAAAEGASCVAAYDALSGIRTLEELQKKIDAGWEKGE